MPTPIARLGYHYYPDDRHFTQKDLTTWLPILESLGARWLTLRASPERAVPESFLRGLAETGIAPIVHIPARVGSISAADLSPLLTSYGRWGVRHVVVFDRPNQRLPWEASDWGRTLLVERFLDRLVPILQAQRTAGLQPVLPPLEPGGDYWDTAFLGAVLASLARRGQQSLLHDLAIGIYAWTFDKPLDWGAGGPSRWPEARPYHTPQGCQDQIGFHIFDWYSAVAASIASTPLPMLVLAGGAAPSTSKNGLGPDTHAETNLAIARALAGGDVPDQVVNFAYYLLAADAGTRDQASAWFPAIEEPRPVVAALQRFVGQAAKQPPQPPTKLLRHYILLPERPGETSVQEWASVGQYALVFRPVVGFSAREARLAQQVTIVGDESAVPSSVEGELRAAGCTVQRVARSDRGSAAAALRPTPAEILASYQPSFAGVDHG